LELTVPPLFSKEKRADGYGMKLTYLLILIGVISLVASSRLFERLRSLPSWRMFFTTSTLFLLIGIMIGPYGINLVSRTVLADLKPVTVLLMGWVGLVLGLQLRWRHLRRTPWRIALGSQLQALVTLIFIAAGLLLCHRLWPGLAPGLEHSRLFWLLAVIGLSTAPEVIQVSGLALISRSHSFRTALLYANFGRITAIGAVGLLYALYRPSLGLLPQTPLLWIGLTLCLGLILGLLSVFFTQHSADKIGDEAGYLAALTGMIIFAAGLAYYLHLSPLLLTLLMGLVIANRSRQAVKMFEILSRYDQPVFMLLLILAGSLLDTPIPGLVPLLLLYLLLRLLGKLSGNQLAGSLLPAHNRSSIRFMLPQGALTLALAINQLQIYADTTASAVFQVQLLGALFFSYLSPLLIGGRR